ncbi:MAG: hypothetical protein AAGJ54_12095 [Planctomycetota bacterium]
MNQISAIIAAMLVQQAERLEQTDPPRVTILSADEWIESDAFRIELDKPAELESLTHTSQHSRITDRGLMIDGQLYCIRIVVPDGTHTMPHAIADGPVIPMPMWPGVDRRRGTTELSFELLPLGVER